MKRRGRKKRRRRRKEKEEEDEESAEKEEGVVGGKAEQGIQCSESLTVRYGVRIYYPLVCSFSLLLRGIRLALSSYTKALTRRIVFRMTLLLCLFIYLWFLFVFKREMLGVAYLWR